MPSFGKVNEADWPFRRNSVRSFVPATVTWCGESSELVHVTVLPGAIVMPPGPKVKAEMPTGIAPDATGARLATWVRPAIAGYEITKSLSSCGLWHWKHPLKLALS